MKIMKKVGILTFHNALNYGALLQAHALQHKLISLGYDAEIIDYDNSEFKKIYIYGDRFFGRYSDKNIIERMKLLKRWILTYSSMSAQKKRNKKLLQFIKKKMILSEQCDKTTIGVTCHKYDKVIVGSDQVWNLKLIAYDTTYMLDFLSDDRKKYSYAASFGTIQFEQAVIEQFASYLTRFSSLLVREKAAQNFLLEKFKLKSEVVVDPTMLQKKDFWTEFCHDFRKNKKITRNYILIYLVGAYTNMLSRVIELAEEKNLDVVSLVWFKSDYPIIFAEDASLEDFVGYINNASYVFTTSFHGIVLSINLNKEFYFELSREKVNNNSRIIDIIEAFGLTEREITEAPLSCNKIYWNPVNEKLEAMRQCSINVICRELERGSI